MPELPEVETIVRGLRKKLTGWEFSRSEIRMAKCLRGSPDKFCESLCGRKILDFARRGKNIIFHLSGGAALIVHLRMTGQLHLVPSRTAPGPHTHAIFFFRKHPGQLRFNDTRKFGRIWLEKKGAGGELPSLSGLGPEPLEISAREFVRRIQAKKRQIKPLLLDQAFLAGVGNIYADESLHRARIHPGTPGGRISLQRYERLAYAIRATLDEAIQHGGSTLRDFVASDGSSGYFQIDALVYDRAGQPCRRCQGQIRRIVQQQRATYFCPACQH